MITGLTQFEPRLLRQELINEMNLTVEGTWGW